jgi:hypothetical protein
VLIDIVNYIKTPQQHDLFADFQRRNNETPAQAPLEPVKPVVTRWNSFYDTFTRAVQLHHAVNAYAQFHIERTKADDIYARSRNNQLPRVSTWMRSDGLIAADWAVIYDYIQVLQPLKKATKRLEGSKLAANESALAPYMRLYPYSRPYSAREKLSPRFLALPGYDWWNGSKPRAVRRLNGRLRLIEEYTDTQPVKLSSPKPSRTRSMHSANQLMKSSTELTRT